jgi:hypothetical protein
MIQHKIFSHTNFIHPQFILDIPTLFKLAPLLGNLYHMHIDQCLHVQYRSG